VRRESGSLLRRLLQKSRGEMVAWARGWWRNGEKFTHDAELRVCLYCMYDRYVLYMYSVRPDSIIGWEEKK